MPPSVADDAVVGDAATSDDPHAAGRRSDGDGRLDAGVRVVALDRDVLEVEPSSSVTDGSSRSVGSGRGSRVSWSRACSRWLE